MRDGTLKGDSAISRAWKELITGEVVRDTSSPPAMGSKTTSPGERGTHTLAALKARQEAW